TSSATLWWKARVSAAVPAESGGGVSGPDVTTTPSSGSTSSPGRRSESGKVTGRGVAVGARIRHQTHVKLHLKRSRAARKDSAPPCSTPAIPSERKGPPGGGPLRDASRNPGTAHLGDLDPVQALRQGAGVAALGELDAQAHLVLRVGVAQRVLVGDLAGLVQLEQALVEGLHAQVGRFLHDLLELVDLAVADVVLHQRRAQQDLHRHAAALAV